MIRANALLDTSVVILLPRLAHADVPPQPAISALTLAELYSRTTGALIAAVAMANGLPLCTCDPADFAGIEGLEVMAVPHHRPQLKGPDTAGLEIKKLSQASAG